MSHSDVRKQTGVAQLVEHGAGTSRHDERAEHVASAEQTQSENSRPLPKPDTFASVRGTGKETSEVVGSSPAPGARSRAGVQLRWRQALGRAECPYAYRWVLPLGRFGSIRLHQWLRSDDERAAHDHPSDFLTLVLFGGYVDALEHADGSQSYDRLAVAAVRYRRAEHRHRVVLTHSPTWTLLYFAPARRDWGFYKRRAIGGFRFLRQHKWFASFGHHPCDQQ